MIKAKGTNSPKIYVIAGHPNEEDMQKGYPLSGQDGQYLLRVLGAFEVSDCIRVVSIYPTGDEEDNPNFDINYIINDLNSLNSQPNVIVTLGSSVSQIILGNKFTTISALQGQPIKTTIGSNEYTVVPAYKPSYVLEELRLSEDEDKYTLIPTKFAKSMYVVSALAKNEYIDVISSKKMTYCLTFQQFLDEYLNKGYINEKELAYDVETTAQPIYDKDLRIIGFSNARKNEGFYVCIESLDYEMSREDKEKTFSLLKDILSSHKVIVHNSMYERPLTLQSIGYDIPYEDLDDTLAMARLMLGGHVGAGLKLQAQTHCGYPDWETDKDNYLSAARGILDGIYNRFYDASQFPDIQSMINYDSSNKWKLSFDESVENFKEICYKYYTIDETSHLLDLIVEKGKWHVDTLTPIPRVLPYSYIPYRIICKYGALDAIATIDIRDHYVKWMKKESTEEVDLFKGYEVILKQMYAGYVLERNGAYWNESIVNKKSSKWKIMAEDALRNMIKSPLIKNKIIENSAWRYYARLFSTAYKDEALAQGYIVEYDEVTDKFKLFDRDGKRARKDLLWELKIPQEMYEDIYTLMMQDADKMNTEELKNLYNPQSSSSTKIAVEMIDTEDCRIARIIHDINVYGKSVRYDKRVRNFLSLDNEEDAEVVNACHRISSWIDDFTRIDQDRDIPFKKKKDLKNEINARIKEYTPIVCKNWRIRGALINNTTIFDNDLVEQPYDPNLIEITPVTYSFKIQLQTISDTFLMDELDDEYIDLAMKISDRDSLKSEFGDEWNQKRKELFNEFKSLYNVVKPHSSKLREMIPEPLESLSEETILMVYEVYQLTGINPDDSTTWTDKFTWLINYRIYKKITKLLTSYVEGAVGRDSVYVVDKDELRSGRKLVIRKGGYRSDINPDEDYIFGATWGVATAETLRWKGGFHTIPWGSPVKKFYTSRYPGGSIVAPDYSQAEIRTLAASAKCEPMLEAFRNGADIHLTTAAAIFNKAPEDVLEVERRFSKMATFSILYGAQYESFAANYLAGDVDRAKQIYDGFYKSYPEIAKWTEDRHNEYKKTGKVSTLVNQFIVIAPGGPNEYQGSLSSALRKAGNYPIQNASSSVVGCVLYEICQYINRRDMKSKPFMFVHDSLEIDVHPDEFIDIISEFRRLLVEIPNHQYGLPSKADFTVGYSLGHELELAKWEPSEDRNSVHMTLEGYRDEIEDTINNWKKVYKTVDIEKVYHKKKVNGEKVVVEGYEDDYFSWDRLFILKRSYDEYVGTVRQHGCVDIFLEIK